MVYQRKPRAQPHKVNAGKRRCFLQHAAGHASSHISGRKSTVMPRGEDEVDQPFLPVQLLVCTLMPTSRMEQVALLKAKLQTVPMTQCFQQPKAFCQTHLLAPLCLCYYLLFNSVIILANSGKVSQDAACWENTIQLSTTSSSSGADLLNPSLPACTRHHCN